MSNKLVVLIDADNISSEYASQIFDVISNLGEAITRRVFGNISAFSGKDGWKESVRQYGIEAFPQVCNVDRKNTADFSLIINAMDCLASGKYDGFVLASSDSDFTSLAQRLRNEKKLVYGIGDERATISFRSSCTQFFELKRTCLTNESQNTSSVAKTEKAPAVVPPVVPPVPVVSKPSVSVPQKKQAAVSDVKAVVPVSASTKIPTEFKKLVVDLKKWKCKKLVSLQHVLMQAYQKSEEETEKIIKAMKSRGYISVDANEKITWLDKQ